MSATASLDNCHFRIQARLTFTFKPSHFSEDTGIQVVRTNFHGDWRLEVHIPKAPESDERTGLGIFIFSPRDVKLGGVTDSKVTLSVQSLRGEEQVCGQFQWDMSNSHHSGKGYSDIIDWNKFWHKDAKHRSDGGFFVLVEITSMPSGPPIVDQPRILKAISQLTQGDDINVFDTKFLVFSSRSLDHAGVARQPLAVYASSVFLQDQSEYFKASGPSCFLPPRSVFIYML
jgi:hypothetical protein